jgi:nicotinate-nucleotide--dimethylbenzimidazole phosphoribosyltransferase
MILTGRKHLEIRHGNDYVSVRGGEVLLRVLYCAVCRTDAKMWEQGHRDLILPRVPGHEIAVVDSQGRRYVVWPGESCGNCDYCRAGRENLCRRIRIIGFHRDGGFADQIMIPEASLIPVPETLDALIACLAEPVGCVLHALEKCRLKSHARVLVYGGGTMGLLAALVARENGADPVVIEKNPDRIKAASPFLVKAGITCVQDTSETGFDAVINACPDPAAFSQGLQRLDSGGCFCFFSGLAKDQAVPTDLINLAHYREITITGSYGLNRADMRRALCFLDVRQLLMHTLIQAVVDPEDAPLLMARVLSGGGFKYVLDFFNYSKKPLDIPGARA